MKIFRLFVAFTLVCFALSQRAQAVVPPPDGAYPNFTTAEGQNALQHLTNGAGNTALGAYSLFSTTTGSFNTAVGAGALDLNTGDSNTAVGVAALLLNTGTQNTAVGVDALGLNTTGASNAAVGAFALYNNIDGSGNTAFGNGALRQSIHAGENTALGDLALTNNDMTGNNLAIQNTAIGALALSSNSDGLSNTATGVGALEGNTVGDENTAIGVAALEGNTAGSENVAVGVNALLTNTTGDGNTAIGRNALFSNSTGVDNIALGVGAGLEITAGNNNIDIGNNGVTGDGNTIRIGDNNNQNATYIGGIAGETVGAGGTACYVDNAGKLGVFLSARRYKENIQPMDNASAMLYSLKPVTFRYKPELDKSHTPQFGLIAEEVAAVNPDLVVRNAKGELSTVRYEAVNAMLLNEFLKEHRTVQELKKQVADLTAGLQKVSAELELSKSASRTVLNKR